MSFFVILIAVGLPCGHVNGFGSCNSLSNSSITSSFDKAICALTAALQATVAINFSSISCFAVLATVLISSSVSKKSSFVSNSNKTSGTPLSLTVFYPNSSTMNPAF